MSGIFSELESTMNALASYLTGDIDKQKYNILIDNCIKQYNGLLRYLDTIYNSYLNNINMYKSMLYKKVDDSPITIKYLDEEYCKGVPNCKPVHTAITGATELNKGFAVLTNVKLRYIINEKDIKDMQMVNSKFQKAYRSYLFNPKKELKYIEKDKFNSSCNIIFSKCVKEYILNNNTDVNKMIPSSYITSEYINFKNLIYEAIDVLKGFKIKIRLPMGVIGDKKIYAMTVVYRVSGIYMNMCNSAFTVYIAKMKERVDFLKKAI